MSQQLRHSDRSTVAPEKIPRVDQSQDDATEDDNALVIQWFNEAARFYGSRKELAFALRCDPSFLTNMCSGTKTIQFRHVVPLLRNPDAARVLLLALLAFAGFEIPQLRMRRRMKRSDVKNQLLLQIDQNPQIFDLFVERIAKSSGATVDEVKDAWSETTDVKEST